MRKILFLAACLILATLLSSGCGTKDKSEQLPQVSSVPAEQPVQVAENPAAQTQDSEALKNEPSAVVNPQQQASETTAATEPPKEKAAETKTDTPKNYSLKVGEYFPPFSLTDLDGGAISSSDLFSSNKVTLINFWGTFCGPCIREMPELEKLWQQYSGQGLGVVGIVLDSQKVAQARTIAAKLGTTYPHLLDDGRYGPSIRAVPMTLLVDSEGKVLVSVTGARTLPVFVQMVEPYL
jgi:peroxiredoxin